MLFESVPVFLKWVQERCDSLELKVETNLLLSLVVLSLHCFVGTGEYREHWKNLQLVELKHHRVYYSGRKITWDNNVGRMHLSSLWCESGRGFLGFALSGGWIRPSVRLQNLIMLVGSCCL